MTRRVLFVCSHLRVGGAQRQWWLLISSLAERGWRPNVLALEARGEFFDDLAARGVEAKCAQMRGRLDALALRRAAAYTDDARPAVVVSHGVRAQVVGHWLARRSGCAHVTADHRAPGFPFKPHRELLIRIVAPHVDRVVAVTPQQIPQIVRRRYRRSAIRVIPNGVSRHLLAPRRTREETRQALQFSPAAFVALFVGVLRPEKRPLPFIDAVSRAQQDVPELQAVIAGYGPQFEAVRRAAAVADGRVAVLGHRDDVGDLLQAADVVCLSSSAEAASMTTLEAMAYERPVVAPDLGGMRDIVADGFTGILVPPCDDEALARAIVALARDPARARALGIAGRARQEREFPLERMIEGYEQLLAEVA